jgi:drug/metabolite transporter (DMT)-like permease
MLAVGLALAANLAYGVSDFLGGLRSRSLPLLSVLLVSQGTALLIVLVVVIVSGESPPADHLKYGVLAGLGEALGVASLYRGLAIGTMSVVAPLGATAPVVAVIAGSVMGEAPSAMQGAGIAIAIAGVVLISSTEKSPGGGNAIGPSVIFGLLTALGFGSFFVGMDAASEGSVPWALLAARCTTMVIFGVAFAIRARPLQLDSRDLPVLAGIGALIVSADSLYAVASTKGLLSVVAVLSSLYPVVTIALARIYLNEKLGGMQRLGVPAALVGAAVVSLG